MPWHSRATAIACAALDVGVRGLVGAAHLAVSLAPLPEDGVVEVTSVQGPLGLEERVCGRVPSTCHLKEV